MHELHMGRLGPAVPLLRMRRRKCVPPATASSATSTASCAAITARRPVLGSASAVRKCSAAREP